MNYRPGSALPQVPYMQVHWSRGQRIASIDPGT
jgi:hypothetical protein